MRFNLTLEGRFQRHLPGWLVERRYIMAIGLEAQRQASPRSAGDSPVSRKTPMGFALASPKASGRGEGGR